jgi:hypothetical protein
MRLIVSVRRHARKPRRQHETARRPRKIGFVFTEAQSTYFARNPFGEQQLSLILAHGNWVCFA